MQESGRLVKIPGIGRKTAERLLLELRGRLGAEALSAVAVNRPRPVASDVMTALLALGYSEDRKSTRLNSSHGYISYAVFCLKKKKIKSIIIFFRVLLLLLILIYK